MKRVPGAIVVLLAGTAAATAFQLPVETIGSRFGGIPSDLPVVRWPVWELANTPALCVWLLTFGLTVFGDLSLAVAAGLALSAVLFIHRTVRTVSVVRVTGDFFSDHWDPLLYGRIIPADCAVFRVRGPMLFGAVEKLATVADYLHSSEPAARCIILYLPRMSAIDGSGLIEIEDLAEKLHESGGKLIVCGLRKEPAELFRRAGSCHIHLCATLDAALGFAGQIASQRAA